ncbi:hypothetical protein Agub_g10672 [Astrephomene gubernaculifera]|uniref:PX domain-containing protein n=1 Tax=Astrephomene gubernaculifera TaxID=47775 RepID=A0AAD3DV94_9CHLO|nr:hypothetical protein Agub_g10672 [Astrephomene gubernaculifera]
MSSLHGTRTSFDPLSVGGDDRDEAFTTVFDSGSQPAVPPAAVTARRDANPVSSSSPSHPKPAATVSASPTASYTAAGSAPLTSSAFPYDSFLSANSGHMSYMTASHGSAAAAVPDTTAPPPFSSPSPPSTVTGPLTRMMPHRPSGSSGDSGSGGVPMGAAYGSSNPFGSSDVGSAGEFRQQPLKPSAADVKAVSAVNSRNPFTATAVDLGPLSFGDTVVSGGAGSGGSADTNTAFSMPLDLYDTPDATFTSGGVGSGAVGSSIPAVATAVHYPDLPAAAASTAARDPLDPLNDAIAPPPLPTAPSAFAAARQQQQQQQQPSQLPPLYDFTREFSTAALPVSEGPMSMLSAGSVIGSGSLPSMMPPPPPSPLSQPSYDDTTAMTAAAAAASSATGGAGPSGSARASISGGGGGGGLMSYSAASLLSNTVSVHSPRKAVGPSRIPGLSEPYIVYVVTFRGACSSETSVERRFRDVVALGELLVALHPGCFLPPRPPRNALEGRRMQPGFVEERRAGIERFLRRLVVHPVLGPSEATQVWLRAPTSDLRSWPQWTQLRPAGHNPGLARSTVRLLVQVVGREGVVPRDPQQVTRPAAEAGDVLRLLHERAAQMRGVLGRVQPSPSEERLRQETATMQDRSEALLALSRRADHLVGRAAKMAAVGGDLAAALGALAEADGTAAATAAAGSSAAAAAAALRAASDGCGKVGKLYGIAADAAAKHLTPLHDWLAAAPGASTALAAREGCLLTLATLEADEAAARRRLAEAEGRAAAANAGPAAVRKVESAQHQVAQLAAAVAAARQEYERVGARNTAELAAFKTQMSRELSDAVREFVVVQMAAAQKAHEVWHETAATLVTVAAAAATAR